MLEYTIIENTVSALLQYLGKKIVISPKVWFHDVKYKELNLALKEWKKI